FESDVHHCAAVLEKYEIISSQRDSGMHRASALAATELEYLVFLVRSMYDILQKLVLQVTRRMVYLDTKERAVQELPRSFREIVCKKETVLSADEIQTRYGLPVPLAQWYAS